MDATARAVVLGGGGVAGTGWTAGLLTGLADAGVPLSDADAIVGTSTGAVAAAVLAHGGEPRTAADVVAEAVRTVPPGADLDRARAAIALMFDDALDPAQARARVGSLALGARFDAADELRGGLRRLFPYADWPVRRLLVTTVRAADGALAVIDAASGVPLPDAVAASAALPAAFPPVEINGLRFTDGMTRSPTNADLAAGAATVIVVEPLAHLRARHQLAAELEKLRDARVHVIVPDAASRSAMGDDVLDPAACGPALVAGKAQGAMIAPDLA